jgi:molybdopterin molybdotransferase
LIKVLSVMMLNVDEATKRLLANFHELDAEIIPVEGAIGRVLASKLIAGYDLPPFPNSAMDGFAVRIADVQGAAQEKPVILRVVGDIPAGSETAIEINPGETARIMTGALVPPSVEAVVPVEDTDFNERQPGATLPEMVRIYQSARAGGNIRPSGQDVRRGEQVLEPGRILRPQEVGFMAMLGISQVTVYRKPRVAIFSTGDELLPIGEPLKPGKIHDSNLAMLLGMVEQAGGEALNLGIARDQEVEVKARLDWAVSQGADLIISTAGVSVGAFDFVKTVVEQNGQLDFWRVNIRPGKPFAFGNYQNSPFFGLPGNPVSAFVSFEVFVRPALCKLTGLTGERRKLRVRLTEAVESDGRETYLRAIVNYSDGPSVQLTGHQDSGNLRSLVQANALLIIPSAVKCVPIGAELEAWLLDG